MKGEKEQKCFEVVKNDFMKEYPTRFFGLNCEEIKNIKVLFATAKINEKISEFPDIILNDGFIEHFQITSSKENKKGAVHIKELTDFKSRIRKEMTEIQVNRDFSEKHWTMPYSEHSYENLVRSFKKNWNNHIESFEKYKGKKDISIFMIQYSDMALEMYENVYENWIDGMSNGDLREPERLDCYRITRDKEILNYMYEFKEKIKYVIFIYGEKCEIIKLENIPYILKLIPWNYAIASKMNAMLTSSLYKLPNIEIGDKINE